LVATFFAGCGDGDNTGVRICEPNEATCSNESNSGEVCSDDGTRFVEFTCAAGETCSEGACTAQCNAGDQRCASDAAAQVCSEDGNEWIPVACSPGTACVAEMGCVPTDEGVQICEPGAVECATDGTVKTCADDGSSWIYDNCADNETCSEGACVFDEDSTCEPREKTCVDNDTSATCADDGSGWTAQECPDGVSCKDGVCQGSACVPGSTRCAPLNENTFFEPSTGGPLPWTPYSNSLTQLYTCNAEGTGWEISTCDAGSYCSYDNISNAEIDQYVGELEQWFVNWYEASGVTSAQPFPAEPDLSDSVASCQEPSCAVPHRYRTKITAFFGLGDYTSYYGVSSFCGSVGNVGGPNYEGSEFTECEGLPPFKNLEWVTYQCEGAGEVCSEQFISGSFYGTYQDASCSSECDPGETICAEPSVFTGTGDAIVRCTENGVYEEVEACPEDTEHGYEFVCTQKADFQGGSKATCMDPICSAWLSYYGVQQQLPEVPAGVGACTPDGMFRPCNPDGTLGEPEECGTGICLNWSDAFDGEGEYYNAAGQFMGYCSDECEDGQIDCIEDGANPLYRTCENGKWSTTTESCEDGLACSLAPDGGVLCGAECAPGEFECTGDVEYRICGDDGQWGEEESCETGLCEDNGVKLSCEMECIPGTLLCSSGDGSASVIECENTGRWGDPVACDGGETCRIDGNGVTLGCVECVGPDTGGNQGWGLADSRCDTLQIQTCNASNQWAAATDCPGDNVCTSSTSGASSLAWCVSPL